MKLVTLKNGHESSTSLERLTLLTYLDEAAR